MTDTESLGTPFHLRERSMEVALLSCWLYCVDIGFVCLWLCWPVLLAGSSCRFLLYFPLLACAFGRAKRCFLPLVYFLLSACASGRAVVFVSSSVCRRRRLLPVGLVLHVLLMHLSTLSLLEYRKLFRSAYVIRFVCVYVCVCVRSRGLGLVFFPFGFPGFTCSQ